MRIILSDHPFGRNISWLRKKYGLSRASLSRLTGICVDHLKCWEEGKTAPVFTNEQLHRLCAIFDISSESMIQTDLEKDSSSVPEAWEYEE